MMRLIVVKNLKTSGRYYAVVDDKATDQQIIATGSGVIEDEHSPVTVIRKDIPEMMSGSELLNAINEYEQSEKGKPNANSSS